MHMHGSCSHQAVGTGCALLTTCLATAEQLAGPRRHANKRGVAVPHGKYAQMPAVLWFGPRINPAQPGTVDSAQ
jgi:hypothetical protein